MVLKSKFLNSTRLLACFIVAGTLQACGGGSGGGTTTPPPPPPPPPPADTTAPSVTFSPVELTVESGQSGTSTLTATDNVGVTAGPSVDCTNGGSFSGSTFTAPTVTVTTTSVCTATASDAAGNSGTGTLTVRIPQPEQPPVAAAVSNISLVSEGQDFILDASSSTDADGDTLTFSWRQISGTAVAFSDTTSAIQGLTAPLVTENETLAFEVTVSDGSDTSSVEVSVIADDLQAVSTDNKATPFFSSSRPLILTSFTPSGSEGYIAHWVDSGSSAAFPTSSQEFSFDGEEIGEQINGEFSAQGAQASGRVSFIFQSSGDIIYVNTTAGYAMHRGRVNGTVAGFGDAFYSDVNSLRFASRFASQDAAPIGSDQLVFVANTISETDDYAINAVIVQPDGSSVTTEISSASSKVKSNLTVEAYSQTEFAVFWWEHNVDVTGTDIYMQRATTAGVLLGGKTLISSGLSNLGPEASVLSDGNLFVTWNNIVSNIFTSKGKIVRPDGSVLVDEFEIDRPENTGGKDTRIVALKAGQAVIVSNPRNSRGDRDVTAVVFDSTGNKISNKFILAEEPDDGVRLIDRSVVSDQNKVFIGWESYQPSEGIFRNYSIGFYPVGKE